MQKKTISKRVLLIVFAVLFVSSLAVTFSITYSKYTSELTEHADADLKAFAAEPILYQGANVLEPTTITQTGDNEGHLVAYYDIPVEDFNDLKVSVRYNGEGKTYLRFKMDMVWYQVKTDGGNTVNEIIFHKYPNITAADNVCDNRSADNWFYFKDVLSSENETVYPALTSITSDLTADNVADPVNAGDRPDFVRIYLTVDCVQYNRAINVWGLEEFPWETD